MGKNATKIIVFLPHYLWAENKNYRAMEGDCEGTTVYVSDSRFIQSTLYLRWVDQRNGCNGTAQITDSLFVDCRAHSLGPDFQNLSKREFRTSFKRRAETSRETLHVLYDDESNAKGDMILPIHGTYLAMANRSIFIQESDPTTPQEFQLALSKEVTHGGQVKNEDRFGIVFASDEIIIMLQQS